jgi:LPPG:FO 2-phospho-L-lactate transferase
LSAGKNFFRLASAIELQPYPARTDLRVAPALRPASDSSMPPAKKLKITALAGGVGASKLLLGFYEVMDPRLLTIIVNTGDDIVLHGLKISPDLDIVTYTLAGVVDSAKGWGIRGETFHALKRLAGYGRANWFNLGDRDLATHIHRTAMLAEGKTLSQAADSIRIALRMKSRILPMSDDPIPTMIDSNEGLLHFQEYLVKRRTEPVVRGVRFAGADSARPAPGVLEAIRDADRVVICPSNPLISIGPILAVPGIREQLQNHKEKVFAVCPLVGGKSLKGPSDKMLAQLGHEPTALGVAKLYADFTGTFVIDPADKAQALTISALGMKIAILPAVMKTLAQKRKLARALLSLSPSSTL